MKEELKKAGWEIERVFLYDNEGVEGWRWTSPTGDDFYSVEPHDDDPTPPEEVITAINSLRMCGDCWRKGDVVCSCGAKLSSSHQAKPILTALHS